jgi:hypothetical protein
MSFLKPLAQSGLFGIGGMAAAGGGLKSLAPLGGLTGMALAHDFGHDSPSGGSAGPSRLDKVGAALNGIATQGGAEAGYHAAPTGAGQLQGAPEVNNHLQMLDPDTLDRLMQHFRGVQYS